MYYTMHYRAPIGALLLASDGESLVGLWNEGQKYHGAGLEGETTEQPGLAAFTAARRWLDDYFAGGRPAISALPLAPRGSVFRRAVWDMLCAIPYGQTTTYGQIAAALAAKTGQKGMAGQAVGGAVGHNPLSIIIPCHRVVGANGSLTGYAGGIDKKIWLLRHEGADMSTLFAPARGTAL